MKALSPSPPLPYTPISAFYKARFQQKIQKIPVTIAETCPNRLGLKGMQTCIFCDEWGSAAYPEQRGLSLEEQIGPKIDFLGRRYRAFAFLVYFQAYTNSFLAVSRLRQYFRAALGDPRIKGLVVGTRPDCLSPAVLELWRSFSESHYVSVELGVQSFDNEALKFLRRGHSFEESVEAILKIKQQKSVDLGIHLIFGLPNETDEQLIQTAHKISRLPVNHVKLHNLHVLRGTPLEALFRQGNFVPLGLEEYARRVILFLQHLSPSIYVHRLVAVASRWNELIAPEWTRYKMRSTQFIVDQMRKSNAFQGQYYKD